MNKIDELKERYKLAMTEIAELEETQEHLLNELEKLDEPMITDKARLVVGNVIKDEALIVEKKITARYNEIDRIVGTIHYLNRKNGIKRTAS